MSDASCLPHFSISVKLETSEPYGHFWWHQREIGGKGDSSLSVDLGSFKDKPASLAAARLRSFSRKRNGGWSPSRGRWAFRVMHVWRLCICLAMLTEMLKAVDEKWKAKHRADRVVEHFSWAERDTEVCWIWGLQFWPCLTAWVTMQRKVTFSQQPVHPSLYSINSLKDPLPVVAKVGGRGWIGSLGWEDASYYI